MQDKKHTKPAMGPEFHETFIPWSGTKTYAVRLGLHRSHLWQKKEINEKNKWINPFHGNQHINKRAQINSMPVGSL